jgi:MFS family permease
MPIAAQHAGTFGRRKAFIAGILIMAVSTSGFGLAGLIKNDLAWYFASIGARVFQGIGDSLILVISPSIIAMEYPEKNLEYQGYFEASMGFGLMMGPVISVIVFRWIGYVYTFLLFAGIIGFIGLPMALGLPERLDGGYEDGKRVRDVPFGAFLKDRRAMMMLLSAGVVAVCLGFSEPVLTLRLEELGMKKENTGLGYVLISVTYILGATLIASHTSSLDHRITVSACLLGEALSVFITSAIGT